MPQVFALGDIMIDIIAHIPRYPRPGGDGIAQHVTIKSGGSAANTARALARCGIDSGLIGRLGSDLFARQAWVALQAAGVDLAMVQQDDTQSSGFMFITVTPDGQRTMIGYRGANVRTDPAQIDPGSIRRARWLHISGYALLQPPQADAARQALDIARRAGLQTSLDPGLEAILDNRARVWAMLDQIDVLLPNEDELQALLKERLDSPARAALHRQGIRLLALKRGEKGCLLCDRENEIAVPAFPIEVVDTTGAGDAFAAGLIAGCLHGLDLAARGLWANAMGALAASARGAHMPDQDKLGTFLQRQRDHPNMSSWQRALDRVLDVLDDKSAATKCLS